MTSNKILAAAVAGLFTATMFISAAHAQEITIGVSSTDKPVADSSQNTGVIAIGNSATEAGRIAIPGSPTGTSGAIAIGMDTNGTAQTVAYNGGVALGIGAQAKGMQASMALGAYSDAAGNYAVAIGSNSQAGGYLSTAFGPGAIANNSNSVALGGNSVTTRDDEVSVSGYGETRYVANVKTGTQDTDATNLGQVRTMANDTLEAANGYTDHMFSQQQTFVDTRIVNGIQQANDYTDSKFSESKSIAYSGAAMAMASSALVFDPNKARQIAMGVATVHGKSSFAAGVAWQTGRNTLLNVRVSTGSNRMTGFAGGFTKSW